MTFKNRYGIITNRQFVSTILSINKTRAMKETEALNLVFCVVHYGTTLFIYEMERLMYILKTEYSFDSAHFLSGYEGKCSNIHGHRWKVELEVKTMKLNKDRQLNGMHVDFGTLKEDLKNEVDTFDHCLIIEKGTLKEATYNALVDEGFRILNMDFRPTAENMSKYFYDRMTDCGYDVKCVTVYETPTNCAAYCE